MLTPIVPGPPQTNWDSRRASTYYQRLTCSFRTLDGPKLDAWSQVSGPARELKGGAGCRDPLERHPGVDAERPRAAHLADVARRRQRAVGERNRNVLRVESVADPALGEQEPAAGAESQVRQR